MSAGAERHDRSPGRSKRRIPLSERHQAHRERWEAVLKQAQERHAQSARELEELVFEAHKDEGSTRLISSYLGVSHQTVHGLVVDARQRRVND